MQPDLDRIVLVFVTQMQILVESGRDHSLGGGVARTCSLLCLSSCSIVSVKACSPFLISTSLRRHTVGACPHRSFPSAPFHFPAFCS